MRVDYNNHKVTLPDFIIAGVSGAGTTFLYQNLCKHPKVFLPEEKEPMFFEFWNKLKPKYMNPKLTKAHWVFNNLLDYEKTFANAQNNQLCGEASATYLTKYNEVIPNLKTLYGKEIDKLKIIIVLRNPVTRLISHYNLKTSEEKENLDLETAISKSILMKRDLENYSTGYQYIEQGMYSKQVNAYLDNFKNTKVFIFEEAFANVENYMKNISKFLKIDYIPELISSEKINISGVPKNKLFSVINKLVFRNTYLTKFIKSFISKKNKHKIKLKFKKHILKKRQTSVKTIKQLEEIYIKDIKKLEKILNRNLDLWKNNK